MANQVLGWLAGRLGVRTEMHSAGDDEALIRHTMG
jgi:hypothetical protein